MSKELIDELIKQLLIEKNLPITWDGNDIASRNSRTQKSGFPKRAALERDLDIDIARDKDAQSRKALRVLLAKDGEPKNLTKKDVEAAFSATRARGGTAAAAADVIRQSTRDSALKKDVEDSYKDSELDKTRKAAAVTAKKIVDDYNKKVADIKQVLKAIPTPDTRYLKYAEYYFNRVSNNTNRSGITEIGLYQQSKGARLGEIFNPIRDEVFTDQDLLLLLGKERSHSALKAKGEIPDDIIVLDKPTRAAARAKEVVLINQKNAYIMYKFDHDPNRSLTYYPGKDTYDYKDANYNYTYLLDSNNVVEPWYLEKSAANLARVKYFLENETDNKVKKYLKGFLDYDMSQPRQQSMFTYNLRIFQLAIEKFKLETPQFFKDMVEKYNVATKIDPKVTKDLDRTAKTHQPFLSQAAGAGEMLSSQFSMFETFFENTPVEKNAYETLKKRIQKLTNFSKALSDPAANIGIMKEVAANQTNFANVDNDGDGTLDMVRTTNKYIDLLNKTMVLDYFNTFAKEIDAGAGAYIFEAFCAYLAGGRVAGKESGLKGGMGETDFFFDSGAKGSAKYLAQKRQFSQAVDNFLEGVEVTYVFASKLKDETIKKGGVEMPTGKEVVASDPDTIHFIDMYVVNIKRLSQKFEESGKVKFQIKSGKKPSADDDETRVMELDVKKGQVKIDVDSFAPAGRLYLVTTDKKSIMDNLETLAEEMDKQKIDAKKRYKEVVQKFKKTFADIESAHGNITEYSNGVFEDSATKQSKGKDAVDSLKSAQTTFVSLASILNPTDKLTEGKKNLALDQLIQTIVKQKLLK